LKYRESDGAPRFRCSEIRIANDDLISKWKIKIEDRNRIIRRQKEIKLYVSSEREKRENFRFIAKKLLFKLFIIRI